MSGRPSRRPICSLKTEGQTDRDWDRFDYAGLRLWRYVPQIRPVRVNRCQIVSYGLPFSVLSRARRDLAICPFYRGCPFSVLTTSHSDCFYSSSNFYCTMFKTFVNLRSSKTYLTLPRHFLGWRQKKDNCLLYFSRRQCSPGYGSGDHDRMFRYFYLVGVSVIKCEALRAVVQFLF